MSKQWKIKKNGASIKIVPVDGTGTIATIIVTSKGTPEEKFENARLIAAAPELLEALERVMQLQISTEGDEIFAEVRAAIAKATGK